MKHLTLPGPTGLLNFLAVGDNTLLNIKCLDEIFPSIEIETEDGLMLLNAPSDSFARLIWV